jgi:pyrroline-5-carboxylate reductase
VSVFQFHSNSIDRHISFIGFGNISQALCEGLISSGVNQRNICVSDVDLKKIQKARKVFGVNATLSNSDALKFSEIVFLCVKPHKTLSVLNEISGLITGNHLIISVAAGVTLSQLNKIVSCKTARVMPNIAVSCRKGVIACAFNSSFTEKDKTAVFSVLNELGLAFEVEESMFDLVTAVSASGTAFWAFIAEKTINAVKSLGLKDSNARKLVLHSINGMVSLLSKENLSEKELIEKVSSKGGVTEAELNVMENSSLALIIEEALIQGIKKSSELKNEK